MKALHVLDHSIPLHSGYTFRTRSILKKQHQLGIETCHVTSPKHGNSVKETETVDDLVFYRSAPPSGVLSKLPVLNQLAFIEPMVERILEVIAIEKPDVIHAHSPALNGLAALKAGKKSGLPVVYEIRAFWEDAAVDHGTCKEGDLRYKLTRAMETHVVKHADAVTTICQGLRKDLIGRGFNEEKFTVIANAVNVEQFDVITEKNQTLEQELSLANKTVLGFLGSFYAYEGLDLAINALAEVVKQRQDIHLLLVGGGPQEDNLKAQVAALGLTDYVTFTGRVPHSEVGRYYSLVDLLVYPRKSMRLTELVTPLKPLEAMAQGKLLLASDVGGHHELITDHSNGYLFKADNVDNLVEKIQQILTEKAHWQDVIAEGRRYVEQVRNWQNSVENYIEIYQKITGKLVK
ncbi:glycosyltransferase, exosortase A system-associated [Thalassotalea sp. 1_MG-2023]|uniref:TIGR04063 family PEP-CTERM/XrtA system glycosyltransferase n=1 Tax=Thalassotalea sp. 1_MG-2023 TaxID=3062680 RepID=UPI0026E47C67|nr:TIGR04063 family PEP-CTERM/XrtA system glycosyltransferase [Thalassotalea sp. 1_MG-2023]MDO6425488.1 glycosyltransferase, exosortase A system-associated [Thalassotalea sp. 1_MG-2023]